MMRALSPDWRDRLIGVGALGVSGLTAYVYLGLAGRELGAESFAPIGALWAVTFLASAALATPLETELARRVGAARGRDAPFAAEVRAALALAAVLGILGVVVALVAGPLLDARLFGHRTGFALAGAVAFAGLTAGSIVKGIYAGSGRLSRWGAYLLADGGSRCMLALGVAVAAPSPAAFALALAAGPWIALLVVSGAARKLAVGASGRAADVVCDMVAATSPLVVGAGASSALTYLGAVVLPALVAHPGPEVGSYIAALSLARLPLFLFSPIVAISVPRIAYAHERDDRALALRAAALMAGVALAGGAACLGGAALAGSGLIHILFGHDFGVPDTSLLALGTAGAAWLFATAAAAVSIASGRPRLSAAGWSAGLGVALLTVLGAGGDPFVLTDLAVAAGAVIAAAGTSLAAVLALLRPTHPAVLVPPSAHAAVPRAGWPLEAREVER